MKLKYYASLFGFCASIAFAADVPESIIEYPVGSYSVKRAVFDEIGSTQTLTNTALNDLNSGNSGKMLTLFRQDRLFEQQVLLVTARSQTAGLGHQGRKWESPIGNVYATFTFPFPESTQKLDPVGAQKIAFYIPQVTNLAVCETVEMFGLTPKFKWINDMLLDGKKCAGILCEGKGAFPYQDTTGQLKNYNAIVVGIGINVNMSSETAQSRFEAIEDPMKVQFTSMRIASGHTFDVENVLTCLTHNLVRQYTDLINARPFEHWFLPRINERLAYIDSVVMYEESKGTEPVQVTLKGLDSKGLAKLQCQDGTIKSVSLGRIRPL